MHRILALWCHPRSVSTAFERMMVERGDLVVLHEPFLYLYYVVQNPHLLIARQLERIEPWMRESFDEISARILAEATRGTVFFKDMAVHVLNSKEDHSDDQFLARCSHAFLIRDPEVSIVSHLRQNPEATFEEMGYAAQWALFEAIAARTGRLPPVVDAADLESEPEGIVRAYCRAMDIPFRPSALSWSAGIPPGFSADDPWHTDLYSTTGFRPGVETFDEDLRRHPRRREFVERARPFYEAMARHRIAPGG